MPADVSAPRARLCLPLLALVALLFSACEGADDEDLEDGDASTSPHGPAPEGLGDDLTALLTYAVVGSGELGATTLHDAPDDLQDQQEDAPVHRRIWALARTIFASQIRWVHAFVVFTDGPDETLASVFQIHGEPAQWALAVDIADALDANGDVGGTDFTYTLVHELGHIIALNADQIPVDPELAANPEDPDLLDEKRAACSTFFIEEGCTRPEAFLNTYYEQFWSDLDEASAQIEDIDDDAAREDAIEAFYEANPDRFVTAYAASNITEDFAESWSYFVLRAEPEGDAEKDAKVLYFYDYPVLVAAREDILSSGAMTGMSALERGLRAPHPRRHRR